MSSYGLDDFGALKTGHLWRLRSRTFRKWTSCFVVLSRQRLSCYRHESDARAATAAAAAAPKWQVDRCDVTSGAPKWQLDLCDVTSVEPVASKRRGPRRRASRRLAVTCRATVGGDHVIELRAHDATDAAEWLLHLRSAVALSVGRRQLHRELKRASFKRHVEENVRRKYRSSNPDASLTGVPSVTYLRRGRGEPARPAPRPPDNSGPAAAAFSSIPEVPTGSDHVDSCAEEVRTVAGGKSPEATPTDSDDAAPNRCGSDDGDTPEVQTDAGRVTDQRGLLADTDKTPSPPGAGHDVSGYRRSFSGSEDAADDTFNVRLSANLHWVDLMEAIAMIKVCSSCSNSQLGIDREHDPTPAPYKQWDVAKIIPKRLYLPGHASGSSEYLHQQRIHDTYSDWSTCMQAATGLDECPGRKKADRELAGFAARNVTAHSSARDFDQLSRHIDSMREYRVNDKWKSASSIDCL